MHFPRSMTGLSLPCVAALMLCLGGMAKSNTTSGPTWVAEYAGEAGGADQGVAVATDSAGNVYVTGRSYGGDPLDSGSDYDFATVRYNAVTGLAEWTMRYNGPANGEDSPSAIAVDPAGYIYVAGQSYGGDPGIGGTDTDAVLVKYDAATGAELDVKRFNGAGSGQDAYRAMKVDAAGNVYLAGTTFAGGTADFEYLIQKYSVDGLSDWSQTYGGVDAGYDEATAIGIDASGNVFVSGYSDGGTTGNDYATVSFDATGVGRWDARYNGPANGDDRATALAVDGSGDVVVHGTSPGVSSGADYATIKYANADGTALWTSRYAGAGSRAENAAGVAVDAAGDVYATGTAGTFPFQDYATVKYSAADGGQQWVKTYNGTAHTIDVARAIAVDSAGLVWVTGYSFGSGTGADYVTIAYAADGTELKVERYNGGDPSDDRAAALAITADNDVIVTGTATRSGAADILTVKYADNEPPVANAGDDQSLECTGELTSVTLDGSASSDPDNDSLTYEWSEYDTVIATDVSPTIELSSGSHEITLTVFDINGACATDTVTIEIVDTVAPEITCPPNVTVNSDPGVCSALVDPGTPVATDLCGEPVVVDERSDGLELTDPFPVGTTTITWTAYDTSGNPKSCDQTVTVEDHEAPTIVPPSDRTVLQESAYGTTVTYGTPFSEFPVQVSDNCSVATATCTPPSGSVFPPGRTVVVCTAVDSAGNQSIGTFAVNVVPPPTTPGYQVNAVALFRTSRGRGTLIVRSPNTFSFNARGKALHRGHITSIVVGGKHARVYGTAINDRRLKVYFVADLYDNARSGQPGDQFALETSDGYSTGTITPTGGDVQITAN